MIKLLKDYETSKEVDKYKVFIKSFGGAKTRCMEDHMKRKIRETPDHVIFLVGTNDLNGNRKPQFISKPIVDMTFILKSNSVDVSFPI